MIQGASKLFHYYDIIYMVLNISPSEQIKNKSVVAVDNEVIKSIVLCVFTQTSIHISMNSFDSAIPL